MMKKNSMAHSYVFLVNVPSIKAVYKEDRCQNDANDFVAKFFRPPISLTLLAGIVKSVGMMPIILDCPACNINFFDYVKYLKENKPIFIIINASEQTKHEDLLALKIAKSEGIKTLAFGYYATIKSRELLEENPYVDYVLVNEPEETIKELLMGFPKSQILGLGYRNDMNEIIINDRRPFIENLDLIPFASNDLLDLGKYRNPLTGEKFLVIQVSRGCPFKCNFCLSRLMNGTRIRTRSVENVVSEIQHCIDELGIRNFFFRADTFTANKSWVKRFCVELLKRHIRIEWYTNTRIDTLDQDILPLMAQSGCILFSIGVESGMQSHQALLGKNLSLDRVKKTLKTIKNAKIMSMVYFMMGTPFDTPASLWRNIEFSRQIDSTFVEFEPFLDLPGIELNEMKIASRVPAHVVRKYVRLGRILFYARPKKIIEMARHVEQGILKFPWRFVYFVKNLVNYAMRVLIK